jgi:Zn finger protein HypA/HybF involved in hydrogenase expression
VVAVVVMVKVQMVQDAGAKKVNQVDLVVGVLSDLLDLDLVILLLQVHLKVKMEETVLIKQDPVEVAVEQVEQVQMVN